MVRQIVDASPGADPEKYMVVYKVVDGAGRRSPEVLSRSEFADWVWVELVRDGNGWIRVESVQPSNP